MSTTPAVLNLYLPAMTNSQLQIAKVCDEIKDLLLAKNAKYGDSALKPCRIFSQSSAIEQILVRIDDKLNRIQKGAGLIASDEDVVNDLIGYLVLLKVAMAQNETKPEVEFKFSDSINGYYGEDPWDGIDIEPRFK